MSTDNETAREATAAHATVLTKLQKIIPEDMCADLEALDDQALLQRIAQSEANLAENEEAQKADEELQAMKTAMKELKAPYREAAKLQRAIQRYCHELRAARGVV
jgi:phosphoenolpyruvate carboxylase